MIATTIEPSAAASEPIEIHSDAMLIRRVNVSVFIDCSKLSLLASTSNARCCRISSVLRAVRAPCSIIGDGGNFGTIGSATVNTEGFFAHSGIASY